MIEEAKMITINADELISQTEDENSWTRMVQICRAKIGETIDQLFIR